jgi:16S rRNA (cytosine967-C5)-methyltransferase
LNHQHADKVLEKTFKFNKQLGSRDRKWIADLFYNVVRWQRRLCYQLSLSDAVNLTDLGNMVGLQWLTQNPSLSPPDLPRFPEWDLGEILKAVAIQEFPSLAIEQSFPDWIHELCKQQFPDQWASMAVSLNEKSPVDLRVNTLKITRPELMKKLAEEEILTTEIPNSLVGLTLKERKNVFQTKSFLAGCFEVQDRASQKVAPLVDPQPGERVIDACAGAGGKTLHLASLMKNKGKIISMDIHEWKLNELRKRCIRNGVDIVETRLVDSKFSPRQKESAHRVLLDVPCSGLGVLRRNPDTKWKLNPEKLNELLRLQAQLLDEYSEMVKPQGVLVYATCSFLRSENEQQVDSFLSRNPGWELKELVRVNPDQGLGDGFFAAKIQRK